MYPIWLLDIDGVINADPYKVPTHVWPEDQWLIRLVGDSRGKDWKITAAQPVLDFITRVHEEKWAEVVWLTTWQHDAQNVAESLFLPKFRVIENPMSDGTRYHGKDWWKLTEFARVYLECRPTIWTDDDISDAIKTLVNETHTGPIEYGDALLLAPKGTEGLAPIHLRKIAEFLRMPY